MSPAKPTTPKGDDTRKKQRVFPTDFDAFATATAAELGDGWSVDTESKPHAGLSAYLCHPDGRRIGIKHMWRGEAVQTWALDVPRREFDNDWDTETYANSLEHLTPGIRYNVGVSFTNNPPAATTAKNIRTRLLPAFDGKRPPLRAFPKKQSRRTPTAKEPTAGGQSGPVKAGAQTAASAKSPRRAAKKSQPKKQPAASSPKRITASATTSS